MTRARIIAHARDYMALLAQGMDPIERRSAPNDSIVSQPRMQRCFAVVAELLTELLENGGCVALDAACAQCDDPALCPKLRGEYELVRKKAVFSLTPEQRMHIPLSREPVTAYALVKRINGAVDEARMQKLSATQLNAWLLRQGYVAETKAPMLINRTQRRATPKSAEIGIAERETTDEKTGEIKCQLVFSEQAQRYLLDKLDDIIAEPN